MRILFILAVLFAMAIWPARSTRADIEAKSHDGRWTCHVEPAVEGGVNIVASGDAGKKITLWKSVRSAEAHWSPDSKFVAIIDHYDPHESAILILAAPDNEHGDFRLIFQTPRNDDMQMEWGIVSWDATRREVTLRRRLENPDELQTSKKGSWYQYSRFTFPLGTATIKQNLSSSE